MGVAAFRRLAPLWISGSAGFQRRFEQHDVPVSVEPARINGDRAPIEQIAANLVDNALKFTASGKAVRVCVRSENGEAVLEVRDPSRATDSAVA